MQCIIVKILYYRYKDALDSTLIIPYKYVNKVVYSLFFFFFKYKKKLIMSVNMGNYLMIVIVKHVSSNTFIDT